MNELQWNLPFWIDPRTHVFPWMGEQWKRWAKDPVTAALEKADILEPDIVARNRAAREAQRKAWIMSTGPGGRSTGNIRSKDYTPAGVGDTGWQYGPRAMPYNVSPTKLSQYGAKWGVQDAGQRMAAYEASKDKDDEESEFDKYMKMQFLSKLIERPKAPSPGYATRAGTARSPVATSIMQTHPGRRQDDLLNYIYGPSYGRRV